MSKIERTLCLNLLRDLFGEVAEQVADYLLRYGSQSLSAIRLHTKIPRNKINKVLLVLIRCSMVEFKTNDKRGKVEYHMVVENVLLIAKYPQYIDCINTLYGKVAQVMVEELIENGQLKTEELLIAVLDRFSENDSSEIKSSVALEKLNNLIDAHFVQRSPYRLEDEDDPKSKNLPNFKDCDQTLYNLPMINLDAVDAKHKHFSAAASSDEPAAKKPRLEIKREKFDADDSEVLWRLNFDRFHEYFRDELIVLAVTNRIGKRAGTVMQALLKISELKNAPWADIGAPSSKQEILSFLRKNDVKISPDELDKYLIVIAEDEICGLAKVGDSGGGTYYMNYKKVIYNLLIVTLQSVVREKFGDKAARIFRLILIKKYLEQSKIEKYAMINGKDAKELTYNMYHENFLEIQELSSMSDYNPKNTFYLFHVDLVQLTRNMLEHVYKSMYNVIIRREVVLKQNKRVLEKKQKVDAIVAALRANQAEEEQIQEVEESITSNEKHAISKLNKTTQKIWRAEMQLDENAFIYRLAMKYKAFKSP